MTLPMMEDEAAHPVDIRLLGSIGVVFGPQSEPQAVEEAGRLGWWPVD